MKRSVCVDLDGVLASYRDGWKGVEQIGDPIPGAVEFTRQLSEFARVVIFTTRVKRDMDDRPPQYQEPGALLALVQGWLDRHGFTYDEIYEGQGKPIASAYIDDRAVVCRPESPFVGMLEGGRKSLWRDTLNTARNFCEGH